MSEKISDSDFLTLLGETLSRGGTLSFTPNGTSMLPLLNGKDDTVTLSSVPDTLRKYDVVLYQRENASLVLHRIVRCAPDGSYTMIGDNQYVLEEGITRSAVLALMTAYTKGGREHPVTAFSYRCYCRFHYFKQRIRMCLSRIYHRIKKS